MKKGGVYLQTQVLYFSSVHLFLRLRNYESYFFGPKAYLIVRGVAPATSMPSDECWRTRSLSCLGCKPNRQKKGKEVLGCGGKTIKLELSVGRERKVTMINTRRTTIDFHTDESDEQQWPPLPVIIEIVGGWEQLSQMMATVVRETLRQGRAYLVDEEEGIAPVKGVPTIKPTA